MPFQVSGLSLAGAPAVVAGSNGQIAWGFTNATADWTDVIALKLSADGTRYQSPTGEKPLRVVKERIEVAGAPAEHSRGISVALARHASHTDEWRPPHAARATACSRPARSALLPRKKPKARVARASAALP